MSNQPSSRTVNLVHFPGKDNDDPRALDEFLDQINARTLTYSSRADFITATADLDTSDGLVIRADGVDYIYSTGATAISDLLGWLPYGDVKPAHWGIAQQTDEGTKLQAMFDFAAENDRDVVLPGGGDFYSSTNIVLTNSTGVHWRVEGAGTCKIKCTKATPDGNGDTDYFILVRGQLIGTDDGTADIAMGSDIVTIADTTGYQAGDLIQIRSTRLIQADNQGTNREGQIARVKEVVSGTQLRMESTAQSLYKYNDVLTGAIVTVNSTTSYELAGTINREQRDMLLRMELTSGANSGAVRYITGWDNSTKDATFDVAWPSGTLAGDTYSIEWTYEVVQSRPARVHIEPGLEIYRDKTTNATGGDNGFVGIRFQEASGLVEDLTVRNFSDSNIRLIHCYDLHIARPKTSGANRCYSTTNGTGYGVVVNQSWNCGVDGGSAYECRRGFDIGGAQLPSHNCYARNFNVYAGGVTYNGNDFWPAGTHIAEGWGSHGPAFSSLYQGCKAYDCSSAVNLRGVRERVLDCAHYGAGDSYSILVRHGGGHVFDGYVYDDLFSEIGEGQTTRHQPKTDASKRPDHLIRVATNTSDSTITSLPLLFLNMTASKIVDSTINLHGSGTAPPISFGNIRVWASDEDDARTVFRFIREDSAPKTLTYLNDLGGNMVSWDGSEYTSTTTDVSTGAVSYNWTDITPSARELILHFVGTSTDGSSPYRIYIGDAGGLEASGYRSVVASGVATQNRSDSFVLTQTGQNASDVVYGEVRIVRVGDTNGWVCRSYIAGPSNVYYIGQGYKELSGRLDRLRLTTVNGTDVFDAGTVYLEVR